MSGTEVRSPVSRRGSAVGSGQSLSPGARSNPSRGDAGGAAAGRIVLDSGCGRTDHSGAGLRPGRAYVLTRHVRSRVGEIPSIRVVVTANSRCCSFFATASGPCRPSGGSRPLTAA